jgi:hypothetical protein
MRTAKRKMPLMISMAISIVGALVLTLSEVLLA